MSTAPSTPEPTQRVKSPRQARSQRSLDRIVHATRKLLDERSFDEISIHEIVREARSSVGAFYARFTDKATLLDHLDELYAQETIDEIQTLADAPRSPSLDRRVETVVRFLVDFHRARRGVIRALILHARLHVQGPFSERTSRMNAEVDRLVAYVRGAEPDSRPSETAVRLGFVLTLAGVREWTLFSEGPAAVAPELTDAELSEEISAAWLGYLEKRG